MDTLVTIETDLFEHREVKPHFINRCCFGEDFAAWLKERLIPVLDSRCTFSDPIQEDYGWGFWVWCAKDPFWVALSYVGDGPQEAPAQWVISVNYDPGPNIMKRLFHKPDMRTLQSLKEHIRQILTSNTSIRIVSTPRYGP